MRLPKPINPIRGFAVIVVAVISAYIMWMGYRLVEILSAPDWCARAINAEKLSSSRVVTSVELCKDLLLKQIGALAINSHIYAGVVALCLLTLIVIVIAGGKLGFSASKAGVSANIGREEAAVAKAVDTVVEATETAGEEVKGAPPEYDGPAMPEPKL